MVTPRHSSHRVKRGDTLWSIAATEYGDPTAWPEIARANRLPKGDLILVGMNLKLPALPVPGSKGPVGARPAAVGVSPSAVRSAGVRAPSVGVSLSGAPLQKALARPVLFPAAKFKLDHFPAIEMRTPHVDYKLKYFGEVTVQQKGTMAEVELSSSGNLSGSLRTEYESKLIKMVGQSKIKLNPLSNTAEVSSGFSVASKVNGKVFVTNQVDFLPPNRFKYTYKNAGVSGEFENLVFKGTVGYELEVAMKDGPRQREVASPSLSPNSRAVVAVTIGALVVAGVAIIVADIVKDVATAGIGAVESPLSWSAAMALFGQAAAMAR